MARTKRTAPPPPAPAADPSAVVAAAVRRLPAPQQDRLRAHLDRGTRILAGTESLRYVDDAGAG